MYSQHKPMGMMRLMNQPFEQWETDYEIVVEVQNISSSKSHPTTIISCSSSSPTHAQHGANDAAYVLTYMEQMT